MKRLKAWLLPVLTVFIVLTVTVLPQRLSALQDQKLMENIHAEPLIAENSLPTQPPDLAQRIELLACWMDASDVMASQQELSGGAIHHELAGVVLDELYNMTENSVLPKELLPGTIPSTGVYQLYLQRQLVGAKYYVFDTYIEAEGVQLWVVLDGETKQILWLELGHPAMEWLYETFSPTDIGAFFLDRLGIENDAVATGKFDSIFQIPNLDIAYAISLDLYSLKISPMMTYLQTDTTATTITVE